MANDTKSKEKTNVSKNVEKLVDEISKLSVLEVSDLVSALQERLGVSAMPVAAAPAAGAPAAEAPAAEAAQEQGGAATQTLTMTGSGDNKISVIKALREINQNWGLKEAKDMTENLPAEILKDAKAEDVKAAADKLKTAGASVEIK
jgi:large subunit ribosomal protein L7/L12